ncbi:hypothetical protein [Candidatus Binatus soli]|uniref:hypothetical protein n=1 Tax=Candidatus Binatus soli TaxID=1953413 RepID=UPI003D0A4170
MFFVENDRAFFDCADRQRVGELFELARREPGDILEAPQSSAAGCSNRAHLSNLAGGLAREQNNARDIKFIRRMLLSM